MMIFKLLVRLIEKLLMSDEEIREYIEILDMLKVELNSFKMVVGEIIKNHLNLKKLLKIMLNIII